MNAKAAFQFDSRIRRRFGVPGYSDFARGRGGFTLVELMISIALVLVIMLGVNFVFKTTTDAVSGGQAINGFNRESQSGQTVLFDDFRNIAKNGPCFIIASQRVTQYLNTADAATGNDPSILQVDNSGTPQGVNPVYCDYRSHRVDLVRFFAHGFYPRRSANAGTFSSPTTATDAFITLGHVALPRYDGTTFRGPITDGPNGSATALARIGSYASDWVLGRSVILLKDPSTNLLSPTGPYIENCYPRVPNSLNSAIPGSISGAYTTTVMLNTPAVAFNFLNNLTPLSENTPDVTGVTQVQSSRYDLANVTLEQFQRYLADSVNTTAFLDNPPKYPTDYNTVGGATQPIYYLWWCPLAYDPNTLNPSTSVPGSLPYFFTPASAAGLPYQFGAYAGTPPAFQPNPPDLARMQANPLIPTPLTSDAAAEMAPYFLQHCSQFIVEYAGDYLTQDNNSGDPVGTYGQITGIGSDGQIDFYVDPTTKQKRIRWYGMPRSSTNGATVKSVALNGTAITADSTHDTPDVVPLRDYYVALNNSYTGVNAIPPWEVDINFELPAALGTQGDYANPAAPTAGLAKYGDPANPPRYVAAWNNGMPAMIRILVKVDDPNNKVKDGPWYEFIFKLK